VGKEISFTTVQNDNPYVLAGPGHGVALPTGNLFLDRRLSTDKDGKISSYLRSIDSGPASLKWFLPNTVMPVEVVEEISIIPFDEVKQYLALQHSAR